MNESLAGVIENLKINQTTNAPKNENTGTDILNQLIDSVKRCQNIYGGKKELATENDPPVLRLCEIWEKFLSHGLIRKRQQDSILKSVQDIVSGVANNPDYTFWDFARKHLTAHEKERYNKLHHVWTDSGRYRALLRSALNEHSLERYILIWLSDSNLESIYEPWALLRNAEAINLLPSMAAGLSSILFAITIDAPELNVSRTDNKKNEPIIYAPRPTGPMKKQTSGVKRQIISFDENYQASSPPKELSVETPAIEHQHEQNPVNRINVNEDVCLPEDSINISFGISGSCSNIHSPIESGLDASTFEGISPSDQNYLVDPVVVYEEASPIGSLPDSLMSSESQKSSSLRSSTSSITSKTEINQLKNTIKDLTERCTFLESRVAELSLENRRLKWLTNHTTKDAIQFLISIPRAVLLRNGPRKYYAYQIHCSSNDRTEEWIILKRYSEFHRMHSEIKKNNAVVKALDFPPKKIGNMDISFVEERRQRLQIYLRHLIAVLPEIAACTTKIELQNAFPFLK